MLRYEQVKGKERQFQSLVGMSGVEFEWLHNYYEAEWKDYLGHFTVSGEVRSRLHRKRKDGKLEDTHDQLLFVLHYLKSNTLQEHHAVVYEPATGQQVDTFAFETSAQDLAELTPIAGTQSRETQAGTCQFGAGLYGGYRKRHSASQRCRRAAGALQW